jgi:hypothetical protein
VGKQADFLEDVTDAPAELEGIPLACVPSIDDDLAAVGNDEPVDQLQERALARAAPPDQGDRLAGRDVEIEAAQDDARGSSRHVDIPHGDHSATVSQGKLQKEPNRLVEVLKRCHEGSLLCSSPVRSSAVRVQTALRWSGAG